jgi:hypothetical protein
LSSGYDPAVGSYEHANKVSLPIKRRKFLYELRKYSFPKEYSDPLNWPIFKEKWVSFDVDSTQKCF